MDFRDHSVEDLAARVRARELSARELTQAALDRIDELNGVVNAFVAVDPERSLAEATAVDEALSRGDGPAPLAGIPLAVKDLEAATGYRTTFGSVCHRDDPPAERDSVLVGRLRRAGCVVVGKTNTPEHGWKAETDNTLFGATRNPWNLDHVPGGSSGGAAAALAAGMVPLATGSDGGGSIRIPAAVCGLSGLKPSLGRIPTGPEVPEWQHLSTRGPMALRIRDVASVLDLVRGPVAGDPASLPSTAETWRSACGAGVPGRVGWSPDLGYADVDPEVLAACRAAVDALADAGAEIVEVPALADEDPVSSWLTMAGVFNARSLRAYRDTPCWDQVDPVLRLVVDGAESLPAAAFVAAVDECHRLAWRLGEVMAAVDVLVCPVTAGVAPRVGERGTIDGEPTDNWVQLTYPFNMTRSPAGTATAGFSRTGVPIGLQVVGHLHDDAAVLATVAVLEDRLGLGERHAPI